MLEGSLIEPPRPRAPAPPAGPPPSAPIELPAIADDGEMPDVPRLAREYLVALRSSLRAWHDQGAGGAAVVDRYTAGIDRLIRFLFDSATVGYRRRYVQLDQRCAVIAQGGYGRAELNPYSDIDLLFLYPHKVTPYVETVTEKILYLLWDLRLTVGHAVRNVRECVRLAAGDLKIKTALIDARYICGDPALSQDLERALDREIRPRAPQKFFREKLLESEARHHQYGDSVYLLEPQIKEGEGGLRDLHTALWIAKVKFKVASLRELAVKGVMTASEVAELDQARDFLLRVRNALHFISGTHQDQLTFEAQELVADNLGYRAAEGDPMKSVEHFLKDYYLHASSVTRYSQAIIDRSVNPPRPYRLIGRMMARTIRPGVQIIAGELNLINGSNFEEDPTELVRLFADAQAHGVPIAPRLVELIRGNAFRLGPLRESPRVAQTFLDILRAPSRVYETLHEMHKLGVLAQILPEWVHLLCLVLHDLYHIYTVDEHSLMGVRELERLRNGEHAETAPLLTQAMREAEKLELLFLGILLHDSGKGLGGGHSEKGAAFARAIAGRLGLNEDDARELEFLVRHHLDLSHLAQRRDIHDDKLVIDFAKRVGSPEALRRLYLLTYADMRATGPKVWNNWKDMLLGETYLRLQEAFARGLEPEDRAARTARIDERVLAHVRGERGPEVAEACAGFLATMPDTYLLSTPEDLIASHFAMVRRLDDSDGLVTSVVHHPQSEFSEFTVVTRDRPGLFALLTGVLAASGLNIVGARIATSNDGVVVDAFRVSHLERREMALDEARWQRVRDLLEAVLAGRQSLAELLAKAERPGILDRKRYQPRVANEVVVDNAASDAFTVLDVYTHDRVGVLHRIANALFLLGLDIHLAKITTNVDQVLDVFYVTEADGRKSERVDEIRSALFAALSDPNERAAEQPA